MRLPVTSCIVDSAAIYITVVKFRNTIWPPPPQLSLHRRAALSSNSNGTRSVYSIENPKRSLYCEMSVCRQRPHLYCGGENLKYYLAPLPPQFFLPRRATLRTNSMAPQTSHKGGGCGGSLHNLLMSMG
jgi:hypothetical protein